jgi:alpha-amylase/alpha-mannosidase (GH57 family)
MNRYICIHGHFYQPPRENPWLEEVELQDSALPYHDWNERITSECYARNASSRILDPERKIIDIINNYSKISFNFGPTLLSWLERHEPDVYEGIIEADRISKERFSGHGSAIAQVYNHMIMPLANTRDKYTQVLWGIKDFEKRFGRTPEGMWLAETAIDIETLDIMAELGISFTILAPHQAKEIMPLKKKKVKQKKLKKKEKIEKKDETEEKDKTGEKNKTEKKDENIETEVEEVEVEIEESFPVDLKKPYLCRLRSGRSIVLFFYDGQISLDVAFKGLLANGENFANRLMDPFTDTDEPQLVHIATDGETYGHHHYKGDMGLAYCLYHIESHNMAHITIYGEYMEKFPPAYEVEILEGSSWSCIHGIGRWQDNCGCNSGGHPQWNQQWRKPLRKSLDWLRDQLIPLYENEAAKYLKDPWHARDEYINLILNRSQENFESYLSRHASKWLTPEENIRVTKLLELQRHAMLMYTSCGWFFDELSGIETTQVMKYAARAIQLAQELLPVHLESDFIKALEQAPSNVPEFHNGAWIYENFIRPSQVDVLRVGAHYAILSLFKGTLEDIRIYSFHARSEYFERFEAENIKLAVSRTRFISDITRDEHGISFVAHHTGGHNVTSSVSEQIDEHTFYSMLDELRNIFSSNNITEINHLIERYFGQTCYTLGHLFKDDQQEILEKILGGALKEVEDSFHYIVDKNYEIMNFLNEINRPLPRPLTCAAEFVFNTDIRKFLQQGNPDIEILKRLISEVQRWSIQLDREALILFADHYINNFIAQWADNPEDISLLTRIEETFQVLLPFEQDLNVWKSQNIYFRVGQKTFPFISDRAAQGDGTAQHWIEVFKKLGDHLQVKVV